MRHAAFLCSAFALIFFDSVAQAQSGGVVAWGNNNTSGQITVPVAAGADVIQVAGGLHTASH